MDERPIKQQNSPIICSDLTEEQFNCEIEKGITSINEGRVMPSALVRKKMQDLFQTSQKPHKVIKNLTKL